MSENTGCHVYLPTCQPLRKEQSPVPSLTLFETGSLAVYLSLELELFSCLNLLNAKVTACAGTPGSSSFIFKDLFVCMFGWVCVCRRCLGAYGL